jgi:leucine-rich repeat protein SHOC2
MKSAKSKLERALSQPRTAKRLQLDRLGLTELPAEVASFTQLQDLDVSDNKLSSLPEWLVDLPLRRLNLSVNAFRELPDVVTRLSGLVDLRIRCCHGIERIPPSIARLQRLETLVVVHMPLQPCLEVIGELGALRRLSLCNLGIEDLPEELSRLGALTELIIEQSSFRTIPPALCRLPRLQVLKAALTRLETLPAEISELPKLKTLDLSTSKLPALPDSFGGLRSLTELNLSQSALTELPGSFEQLSALQTLRFSALLPVVRDGSAILDTVSRVRNLRLLTFGGQRGPLRITPEVFSLPALEHLYIGQWNTEALPDLSVEASALKSLMLTDMRLEDLPASWERLAALEKIVLERNAFEMVPDVLARLPKLRSIQIRGNRVKQVPTWAVDRGVEVVF